MVLWFLVLGFRAYDFRVLVSMVLRSRFRGYVFFSGGFMVLGFMVSRFRVGGFGFLDLGFTV